MRRRRRTGAGAIVRAIEAQGDRIVAAIREASAEQKASREEMGANVLRQGAGFLRAALDQGRAMGLGRVPANDAGTDDAPDR